VDAWHRESANPWRAVGNASARRTIVPLLICASHVAAWPRVLPIAMLFLGFDQAASERAAAPLVESKRRVSKGLGRDI
jgi:hypothetical protein